MSLTPRQKLWNPVVTCCALGALSIPLGFITYGFNVMALRRFSHGALPLMSNFEIGWVLVSAGFFVIGAMSAIAEFNPQTGPQNRDATNNCVLLGILGHVLYLVFLNVIAPGKIVPVMMQGLQMLQVAGGVLFLALYRGR